MKWLLPSLVLSLSFSAFGQAHSRAKEPDQQVLNFDGYLEVSVCPKGGPIADCKMVPKSDKLHPISITLVQATTNKGPKTYVGKMRLNLIRDLIKYKAEVVVSKIVYNCFKTEFEIKTVLSDESANRGEIILNIDDLEDFAGRLGNFSPPYFRKDIVYSPVFKIQLRNSNLTNNCQ